MFDLTGKVALVTGSTQGIGFAIAKTLAEHGAKVFISGAASMEKSVEASKRIPESVPTVANLMNSDDIDGLYAVTGDVDILVLSASIQYKAPWDEFTEEQYETMISCNLTATYKLIKKYSKAMKEKGYGRIVTIGSVNQYNQHPELSLYGVTKVAQTKLVKNIAPALAPYGVTVNNVAPGAISTPRNKAITDDPELKAKVEKSIPMGRFGTPEDVSPMVLLLCSDEGGYITGSDIVIDGGMSLR